MNQKLTDILETQAQWPLEISEQNFSNQFIDEKSFDSCIFVDSNFSNCHFDECDFLGSNFYLCLFENCDLAPRLEFFKTSFINCQFSNVDFSSISLFECEFRTIDLASIKLKDTVIVGLKNNNITFKNLQFDEADPMIIFKSNKDFFLDEGIKVRNSLEFLKQIKMN